MSEFREVGRHKVEIRRNDDGTIDEVVAYGPDGDCWFHLEQLDDDGYYFGIYDGVENLEQFDIWRRKKRVIVRAYDDPAS